MSGLTPQQRLADLETFVARHQRMPRSRIRGECGSASWASRVRNGHTKVPAEIRQRVLELAQKLPHRSGRPLAVPAAERIAQLHAFVVANGRLPRERNADEAALARWSAYAARPKSTLTTDQHTTVRRIRSAYRGKRPHRRA